MRTVTDEQFHASATFLHNYPDEAVQSAFGVLAQKALQDILEIRELALDAVDEADMNTITVILELAAAKSKLNRVEADLAAANERLSEANFRLESLDK